MKKSILLLFAFVALSTTAFAQEDESSRSFYFYVDGNTGQLNGSAKDGDLLDGYWACAGLGYEHGFANGFGFTVGAIVFDSEPLGYDTYDDGEVVFVNKGSVLDYLTAVAGVSYGIGGFSSYINLTTAYVVEAGVAYGHSFGDAGSVRVSLDACFSPYDGVNTHEEYYGYVDFFEAQARYSIGFAENWGFSTRARFRFGDGSKGEYEYEDESGTTRQTEDERTVATAFAESFVFRWDNVVSYDATDSLGLYAMVRYQAFNIANNSDVAHAVSVGAGISYAYDLK